MALNQHKTDINLIGSIDALTEIFSESRLAAEPAFRDRPMSANDPVPDNPFWTPKNCYLHALNGFHKRWPNAEGIISSDPKAAVDYAVNVLDDVWPDDENGRQAEKLISKDPGRALWYAKMLKGRWEEIEPAMASKASWAYEYAKCVLEHQWDGPHAKDAEIAITSDPWTAMLYCVDLKYPKRYDNPRIERMILDSIYGALYAHTVAPKLTIKELNQEVDSRLEALNVGQNVDFSNVFEESYFRDPSIPEPDIKTSKPGVLVNYAADIIQGRWPEAEPYILDKCLKCESRYDRDYLFSYALNVIMPFDKDNPNYDRGRWIEAEPIIGLDPHTAYSYARIILKERWQNPDIELNILDCTQSAKYYAEYVAKTSEDELREDVESKIKDMHRHDDIDLSDTTDEAIDRLLPLIVEAIVERDYSTMTPATVYTYTITDYKTKQLRGEDYEPDPKAEAVMIKDPGAAYYYARDVINDGKCLGKRWKEAEPIIMSEPYWAYAYAKDALGGRWRDAEKVIKSDTYIAYLYARYIIKPSDPSEYDYDKGRWDLKTESRILEDHDPVLPENDSEKESEICELYANNVAEMSIDEFKADIEIKISGMRVSDEIDLSGTTEEGLKNITPIIVESREDEIRAMALYHLALDKKLVKDEGLTPEQQSEILKSPEYAYKYAKYVLEGEWVEAEPIILTETDWAYNYAKYVIKGRWEAVETDIMARKDPLFSLMYATDVSKIRLDPMVELRIIEHFEDNDDDGYHLDDYCTQVAKMSVEDLKADAEMKISELTSGDDIDLSDTTEEGLKNITPIIVESREDEIRAMALFHMALNKKNAKEEGLTPEQESGILKSPEYAYKYAKYVLEGEWVEAEPIILTNIYWAYNYAKNVIGGKWEAAEPLIMAGKLSEGYALSYALDISKIRLNPLIELRIIEHFEEYDDDDGLDNYCAQVAKMSVEALKADAEMKISELTSGDDTDLSDTVEEAIDRLMPLITENKKKPEPDPINMTLEEIYRYASKRRRLDKRWPEAEPYIKKDPRYAFIYASGIINKGKYLGIRWPAAEPYIKKDPKYAYMYTYYVINKSEGLGERWPEAEPYIMRSPEHAYMYTYNVINKGKKLGNRWREAEPDIIKDPDYAIFYADRVARMPYERFLKEVEATQKDLHPLDDKDLTGVDESIDRLMPLITEALLPDPHKLTPQECYNYAYNFILKMDQDGKCKQWLSDAEEIIKHSPEYATWYAVNVLNHEPIKKADRKIRFLKAEEYIMKSPKWAFIYARDIYSKSGLRERDKLRWEDAEPFILKDPKLAYFYAQYVAHMPLEQIQIEVDIKMGQMFPDENKDLSDTTDEAIARLMPLIIESEEEPDFEKMTPHDAYDYVRDYKRKHKDSPWREPDPRAARIIMKDPHLAECFATYFINQGRSLGIRWPEAEPIIKTKASSAYFYAKNVLRGRWRAAEDVIKRDTFYAFTYAFEVVKPSGPKNYDFENGRWDLETEIRILQDHDLIVPDEDTETPSEVRELYALRVAEMSLPDLIADVKMKTRDITANDDIDLTDTTEESIDRLMPLITESEEDETLPDFKKMTPVEAFEYVYEVINQDKYLGIRCPEAEPVISKDPELAYYYAMSVINKDQKLGIPWPEAERAIGGLKDNSKWAFYYVKEILNQGMDKGIRWLECESAIITDKIATAMYAKDFAKMPVDEFINEVNNRDAGIMHRDNEDLSGTFEEAIEKLMPLISENKLTRPDPSGMTAEECIEYLFEKERKSYGKSIDRWVEAEPIIMKDANWAPFYAAQVLQRVWPEAEPYILTTARSAFEYSRDVIKGTWPKAEPLIMTSPALASYYATAVMNKNKKRDENGKIIDAIRWKDAEDIIKSYPTSAYEYAHEITGERWDPDTEMMILNYEYNNLNKNYAKKVAKMSLKDLKADVERTLGQRDPDSNKDLTDTFEESIDRLMPLIGKNKITRPDPSGMTAYDCLEYLLDEKIPYGQRIDRWVEAEPIIMKDPDSAVGYAAQVLQHVWPEAEPYIISSANTAFYYSRDVIKGPWPKAEPIIISSANTAFYYSRDVIKGPWPKAEPIIMKSPEFACQYTISVMNLNKRREENGKIINAIRWKDAEDIIKSYPTSAYDYADVITGERWDVDTEMMILDSGYDDLGEDYAKNVAKMSLKDLKADVEYTLGLRHPDSYKDLTDTFEESIDRLMPLISEANRKDYWGRRKEFKENYPISNWLDKAINKIKARFFGSYSPQFQQSIKALKAKADEYREKGAENFKVGAHSFSLKVPYPPNDVLDDLTLPRSIKSLLIGAFHDEESKLSKEYENSLADTWEQDWPAPAHSKQDDIQYDLRRRLKDKAIKNRKEIAKYKDTTAHDDTDLSDIEEE